MSPRSTEFMDQALDRAAIAREVLASGHLEGAVSAAYYAMLYAARAALSEDDAYARTHNGAVRVFPLKHLGLGLADVDDVSAQLQQRAKRDHRAPFDRLLREAQTQSDQAIAESPLGRLA